MNPQVRALRLSALIAHSEDHLHYGRFIQPAEAMFAGPAHFAAAN